MYTLTYIYKYKSSMRSNNASSPLATHFNLPGNFINDLILTGIDHFSEWIDTSRKDKESFWIMKLHTITPMGLHLAD